MNECHLPQTGKNKGRSLVGIQVISGDWEKARGWDLLTHGGFLTYPHHDARGLCTYVTPRSGTKIWAYVDTQGGSTADRKSLFKMFDRMSLRNADMLPPDAPMGVVVIRSGDTLYVVVFYVLVHTHLDIPAGSNHLGSRT